MSDYNRTIATNERFEVLPVLLGGDETRTTGLHHRNQCQHIDLANDICTMLKFMCEVLGNLGSPLSQYERIIESPDRLVQEQWYMPSMLILEAVLGG